MGCVPELRFKEFSEEWEEKKLGDVAEIIGGGTPETKNPDFWNGDINWFTPTEIGKEKYANHSIRKISKLGLKYSSAKLLPVGTVLLSSRATIGRSSIALYESTTNQGFQSLIVNKQHNNEFVYYLIKNINKELIRKASGSTFLEISKKEVSKISSKFPSIDEQEKIAIFLSKIDEKIAILEEKLELWNSYKKGIMQQLFSQELRFKDENGNNYSDWEEKKLEDIGSIVTGSTPPTKNLNNYNNGTYLWVTPTDINHSKVINKSERSLTEEGLKNGRLIPKNSLLVTCIASIGKNCIINEKGSCNQQINAITPYKWIDLDFLYYLIEKNSGKFKQYAGITATPILNKTSFGNMKFLFPQLEEQYRVSNFLTEIDYKIEEINSELSKNKEFKKGLLQKMLC